MRQSIKPKEKSELFSEILGNTFSDNDVFDEREKLRINDEVKRADITGQYENFNERDLYKIINKLKINSFPGRDCIQNIFFKHLPFEYIKKSY